MTGLRKRVTVGFLSIVCLLFFSGMVSFLELSHLSRDTGEILKANKRNIELAKEMLDAAHEQNIALIRLSVFGDRSCDSLCRKSMERLENTLLVAQSEALEKSFLDSLAFDRLPQDDLLSYAGAIASCVRLSRAIDALGYYPACAPGDRDLLLSLVADYERQQAEADALAKQRRARDVCPNESARIRMRMSTVKKSLNATVEEIRGICHE